MATEIIQPRNKRLVDIATYVPLGLIAILGLFVVPEPTKKIMALTLCVGFGLHHAFRFQVVNTKNAAFIHFFIQTAIVIGLVILSVPSDAFYFLLFLLSIQVTLILPIGSALLWMIVFYLINSNNVFLHFEPSGIVNLLFNAAAMFFTAMLGYSLRQTEIARREKEALFEELQETQIQLQELAITQERTRLARELHDSLGHRLTVAVVQLEGAQRLIPTKPEQAGSIITTMRDELKEALADLRSTVTAMRNPVIENQSLEAALKMLCISFQQNTGLATHFTPADNIPALPEEHRLALYRAAQEGLTNIQRHANAKNAWVQVDVNHDGISLSVEDDGRGFNQSQENGGAGLLGLRERAEELDGQVQVGERAGGGARLSINVPLPTKGVGHE